MQRTINRGHRAGYVSGCGIALADTIFAVIAVFSVSFVQNLITEMEAPVQLIMGLVVVVVGIKLARTNPVKQVRHQNAQQTSLLTFFVSIFFLTINPINLLPVLFFTGLLKVGVVSLYGGIIVIAGFICGALSWWIGLTTLTAHYRKYFRLRHIWYINRILGLVILTLGAAACIQALVKIIIH
ncbi:hypothetical protein AGMMS4956_08560 [Bacteroidia bacterium]|nr:hypothetical protein AGMMS4956_08560 [Bacteroidia bacterium]